MDHVLSGPGLQHPHFCHALKHVAPERRPWVILLILIAMRMVYPPPENVDPDQTEESLIEPLAVLAVARPSGLANVLILVSQRPERVGHVSSFG